MMTEQNIHEEVVDKAEQGEKLYAGKYKTTEELEKGYKELSTLVREKKPEAPEVYDFSTVEGIDGENPLLHTMQEVMKGQNLTQEQAESLTRAFIAYHEQSTPNLEEEMKILGAEGSAMIQQVEGFMRRNFTQEEAGLLANVAHSAAGVKLLHKIARQMGEKSIPINGMGNAPDIAGDLRKQASEMFKDPTLRTDPARQEEYDALWQRIAQLER